MMNWYAFWISALIANVCMIIMIRLSIKKPQQLADMIENVERKSKKPLICFFCMWIAVIYFCFYIVFRDNPLIGELALNIGMFLFMLLWGGVLSLFVKLVNDPGEEIDQVVRLDICFALLGCVWFLFEYKEYTIASYLITFILGRFFWLDNINFKNISSVFKEFGTAIKTQGYVATTVYILVLFFVFKIGMSSAVQIAQEVSSGIFGGMATSLLPMFVVAYVRGKSQSVKHTEQTEAEQ